MAQREPDIVADDAEAAAAAGAGTGPMPPEDAAAAGAAAAAAAAAGGPLPLPAPPPAPPPPALLKLLDSVVLTAQRGFGPDIRRVVYASGCFYRDDALLTALRDVTYDGVIRRRYHEPHMFVVTRSIPRLASLAFAGDERRVSVLLADRAAVNAKDSLGRTALHAAALGGKSSVCLRLINAGADVHAKTNNDATPLHLAARNSQSD